MNCVYTRRHGDVRMRRTTLQHMRHITLQVTVFLDGWSDG